MINKDTTIEEIGDLVNESNILVWKGFRFSKAAHSLLLTRLYIGNDEYHNILLETLMLEQKEFNLILRKRKIKSILNE